MSEEENMPNVGTPGHIDHGPTEVTPSGSKPEATLKVETEEDVTHGSIEEVQEVDTSTPTPTFKDMVKQEVQRLVQISRHYQSKIEEAKTKPKKEYFLKKLRKNNKKLADMIIRLDQLNKTGDTSGH